MGRSHLEGCRGIKDGKVCIETLANRAFAVRQACVLCGIDARPLDDLGERDATAPALGPQQAEAQPQGADAAPGRHKVASVKSLQACDTGRVVGYDKAQCPVLECLPEPVAILAVANRGAAFEFRVSDGNVHIRETEILEACLCCEL